MNILTVDLELLDKKIFEYTGVNGQMPYIICCDDTEKIIVTKCYANRLAYKLDRHFKSRDSITQYYGCTILNDNSLKLGEVRIR